MKNKEYWNRRYLMDKAMIINDVEHYLAGKQKEIYAAAGKEIQQQIDQFYTRYAKENQVSLAAARAMVGRAELGKVDWERWTSYSQKTDELPGDVVAAMERCHMEYEQMINAMSKKGSISRLQMLQVEIDRTLLNLYDANQYNIYDLLSEEYENVYYKSLYNTQQCIGYGSNFAALNKRAIDTAILHQYPRGNYSERIYAHSKKLSAEIRKSLTVGMITGENLDKMARRVQKRLEVSFANAKRLVRTETAYTYEQATRKAYEECGIERYEYLATLDRRTSAACRALDGKKFAVKDAMPGKNYPPMHPNCRSTTVCAFDNDKATARLAKDESGNYYEVPSDMTYKQWKKKYVLQMTTGERKALHDYIGFDSYIINERLREGTALTRQEKQMIRKLDAALDKCPAYHGNLVRDLQFLRTEQKEQFIEAHQIGTMVNYPAYTSTSKEEGYNEDYDVRIYIENTTKGKDIASFNRQENEVLYKRDQMFLVKNVIWKQKKMFVLLEEC